MLTLILVRRLSNASRFNKRREDFADLRLYNDYLEMVEDISTPTSSYRSSNPDAPFPSLQPRQ